MEIYIQLACDAHKPDTSVGGAVGRFLPSILSLAGDPDRWKFCSSDPDVQSAVAQLATAMSIATGVLGCLTTAWWGSVRSHILSSQRRLEGIEDMYLCRCLTAVAALV